ncbi:hypothetical protein T484DRAFT_1883839 [Baffinella frigidus]|nr:hypothetical protein T484DRAFT_1883839 [Cryptophyta sp. CCMP2293]
MMDGSPSPDRLHEMGDSGALRGWSPVMHPLPPSDAELPPPLGVGEKKGFVRVPAKRVPSTTRVPKKAVVESVSGYRTESQRTAPRSTVIEDVLAVRSQPTQQRQLSPGRKADTTSKSVVEKLVAKYFEPLLVPVVPVVVPGKEKPVVVPSGVTAKLAGAVEEPKFIPSEKGPVLLVNSTRQKDTQLPHAKTVRTTQRLRDKERADVMARLMRVDVPSRHAGKPGSVKKRPATAGKSRPPPRAWPGFFGDKVEAAENTVEDEHDTTDYPSLQFEVSVTMSAAASASSGAWSPSAEAGAPWEDAEGEAGWRDQAAAPPARDVSFSRIQPRGGLPQARSPTASPPGKTGALAGRAPGASQDITALSPSAHSPLTVTVARRTSGGSGGVAASLELSVESSALGSPVDVPSSPTSAFSLTGGRNLLPHGARTWERQTPSSGGKTAQGSHVHAQDVGGAQRQHEVVREARGEVAPRPHAAVDHRLWEQDAGGLTAGAKQVSGIPAARTQRPRSGTAPRGMQQRTTALAFVLASDEEVAGAASGRQGAAARGGVKGGSSGVQRRPASALARITPGMAGEALGEIGRSPLHDRPASALPIRRAKQPPDVTPSPSPALSSHAASPQVSGSAVRRPASSRDGVEARPGSAQPRVAFSSSSANYAAVSPRPASASAMLGAATSRPLSARNLRAGRATGVQQQRVDAPSTGGGLRPQSAPAKRPPSAGGHARRGVALGTSDGDTGEADETWETGETGESDSGVDDYLLEDLRSAGFSAGASPAGGGGGATRPQSARVIRFSADVEVRRGSEGSASSRGSVAGGRTWATGSVGELVRSALIPKGVYQARRRMLEEVARVAGGAWQSAARFGARMAQIARIEEAKEQQKELLGRRTWKMGEWQCIRRNQPRPRPVQRAQPGWAQGRVDEDEELVVIDDESDEPSSDDAPPPPQQGGPLANTWGGKEDFMHLNARLHNLHLTPAAHSTFEEAAAGKAAERSRRRRSEDLAEVSELEPVACEAEPAVASPVRRALPVREALAWALEMEHETRDRERISLKLAGKIVMSAAAWEAERQLKGAEKRLRDTDGKVAVSKLGGSIATVDGVASVKNARRERSSGVNRGRGTGTPVGQAFLAIGDMGFIKVRAAKQGHTELKKIEVHRIHAEQMIKEGGWFSAEVCQSKEVAVARGSSAPKKVVALLDLSDNPPHRTVSGGTYCLEILLLTSSSSGGDATLHLAMQCPDKVGGAPIHRSGGPRAHTLRAGQWRGEKVEGDIKAKRDMVRDALGKERGDAAFLQSFDEVFVMQIAPFQDEYIAALGGDSDAYSGCHLRFTINSRRGATDFKLVIRKVDEVNGTLDPEEGNPPRLPVATVLQGSAWKEMLRLSDARVNRTRGGQKLGVHLDGDPRATEEAPGGEGSIQASQSPPSTSPLAALSPMSRLSSARPASPPGALSRLFASSPTGQSAAPTSPGGGGLSGVGGVSGKGGVAPLSAAELVTALLLRPLTALEPPVSGTVNTRQSLLQADPIGEEGARRQIRRAKNEKRVRPWRVVYKKKWSPEEEPSLEARPGEAEASALDAAAAEATLVFLTFAAANNNNKVFVRAQVIDYACACNLFFLIGITAWLKPFDAEQERAEKEQEQDNPFANREGNNQAFWDSEQFADLKMPISKEGEKSGSPRGELRNTLDLDGFLLLLAMVGTKSGLTLPQLMAHNRKVREGLTVPPSTFDRTLGPQSAATARLDVSLAGVPYDGGGTSILSRAMEVTPLVTPLEDWPVEQATAGVGPQASSGGSVLSPPMSPALSAVGALPGGGGIDGDITPLVRKAAVIFAKRPRQTMADVARMAMAAEQQRTHPYWSGGAHGRDPESEEMRQRDLLLGPLAREDHFVAVETGQGYIETAALSIEEAEAMAAVALPKIKEEVYWKKVALLGESLLLRHGVTGAPRSP